MFKYRRVEWFFSQRTCIWYYCAAVEVCQMYPPSDETYLQRTYDFSWANPIFTRTLYKFIQYKCIYTYIPLVVSHIMCIQIESIHLLDYRVGRYIYIYTSSTYRMHWWWLIIYYVIHGVYTAWMRNLPSIPPPHDNSFDSEFILGIFK